MGSEREKSLPGIYSLAHIFGLPLPKTSRQGVSYVRTMPAVSYTVSILVITISAFLLAAAFVTAELGN